MADDALDGGVAVVIVVAPAVGSLACSDTGSHAPRPMQIRPAAPRAARGRSDMTDPSDVSWDALRLPNPVRHVLSTANPVENRATVLSSLVVGREGLESPLVAS